jgi:hypothetical protein
MNTRVFFCLSVILLAARFTSPAAQNPPLEAGVAVADITPKDPIWLAGYAARRKPSEKVDIPLTAQAFALRDSSSQRFVFVSLDNCEVSHDFMTPVLQQIGQKYALEQGRVMLVSSHTHSAPVLEHTLISMYSLSSTNLDRVQSYSAWLQSNLVAVVGAALADLKPAHLEYGTGRATFAMNRRVYREDRVDFGENPEGPVDWDVPVLRVSHTNGTVRAILFGYACHGTSIAGDDFYIVSGDYMAYARQHLEANYPGAAAIYLTGMGADANPSPRGRLLDAKRHGLQLAGAVVGVLNRPLRPVGGDLRFAYAEAELPLEGPPDPKQLLADSKSPDPYIVKRAQQYLALLDAGKSLPRAVKLPVAVLRIGQDLTFISMGGEVVVDYALRLKRLMAPARPWLIGYAYEVPCYIPSMRILKEGGYEAQSSLIYYGLYGPFKGRIEDILMKQVTDLITATAEASQR